LRSVAKLAAWATGNMGMTPEAAIAQGGPRLLVPSWPELWRSFEIAVLPQLSLTLTNAVIVTASLARELFPSTGAIASKRQLALSSGLANVLLCPFGAMPMCHGAGGLAAQFRFGARTGIAPIIFPAVLLVLAVGFAEHAAGLFALIPIGAVGSLLIFAGTDLALSRRLFDGKPSCLWVIGATALVTVTVNPALGLVIGWVAELIRTAVVRRWIPERPKP
jgi:MFS superfamily sulfate permease-like transporter